MTPLYKEQLAKTNKVEFLYFTFISEQFINDNLHRQVKNIEALTVQLEEKGDKLIKKADEFEYDMGVLKKELKTRVLKEKHRNNWIEV